MVLNHDRLLGLDTKWTNLGKVKSGKLIYKNPEEIDQETQPIFVVLPIAVDHGFA